MGHHISALYPLLVVPLTQQNDDVYVPGIYVSFDGRFSQLINPFTDFKMTKQLSHSMSEQCFWIATLNTRRK